MAKKNKELKEQLEAITKDEDDLAEKLKCKEMELNIQRHNLDGKFNEPLSFVKASISLEEDFTKEVNNSKEPTKGKKSLHALSKGKVPMYARRKERMVHHALGKRRSLDTPEGKGRSHGNMYVITSHAPRRPPTCHFFDKKGHI